LLEFLQIILYSRLIIIMVISGRLTEKTIQIHQSCLAIVSIWVGTIIHHKLIVVLKDRGITDGDLHYRQVLVLLVLGLARYLRNQMEKRLLLVVHLVEMELYIALKNKELLLEIQEQFLFLNSSDFTLKQRISSIIFIACQHSRNIDKNHQSKSHHNQEH